MRREGSERAGAGHGTAADATLLAGLRAALGEAHVLSAEAAAERASHVWNPAPLLAKALVRPGSTAETARVLALCHAHGQSVVTHGGLSGLAGGERSTAADIVLSLERLDAVESLDAPGRTVTVGAGCVLERVRTAAREAGLQFGLDLGARGACTIGGNIATNAGGLSVLRYGMMREQVLGLEAVLADGTVLSSMNRMMKNNAGYDLKQLFIGSEGTLGVVTRAVLRLRAATPAVHTALVALERFEQVGTLLECADAASNGTLDAYEVLWQPFYRLNTDAAHHDAGEAPLPREHPFYAIVEWRGCRAEAEAERFEAMLAEALERGTIVDAVIAQSERERASIWHVREHIDIALRHEPVFAYDVSLPIADMGRYAESLDATLRTRWPNASLFVYGHVADGNLHVIVAPLPLGTDGESSTSGAPGTNASEPGAAITDADALQRECDEIVYGPLGGIGGSVSAEHGIGLAKRHHLARSRTPEEIALMARLKAWLDPRGILNPGKVVPNPPLPDAIPPGAGVADGSRAGGIG